MEESIVDSVAAQADPCGAPENAAAHAEDTAKKSRRERPEEAFPQAKSLSVSASASFPSPQLTTLLCDDAQAW